MYSLITVMFLSFAYAKFPILVPRILSFILCNLDFLIESAKVPMPAHQAGI